MARMPAAEVAVDEAFVRALLVEQHPDLAALPLELHAEGWDNTVWRLGAGLLVRLPRRAAAAVLVEHEQRWLPVLAQRLPVAVPAPVRVGRPALGYPWSWSVVPWIPGTPAVAVPAEERVRAAEALADVVLALHRPAPPDAPANPVRGVALATRDTPVRERAAVAGLPTGVVELWADLAATPPWAGPPLWLHGDLHPANLVLDDDGGRLAGVVDFGDLTAGDPATDLATAWLTFDRAGRALFRDRTGGRYDAATWRRARGWALSLATALLAHSDDAPVLAGLGERALAEVLAG